MNVPYLLRLEDGRELREEILKKQDEFLDAYSLYLKTGLTSVLEDVRAKARELRALDPGFSFQI